MEKILNLDPQLPDENLPIVINSSELMPVESSPSVDLQIAYEQTKENLEKIIEKGFEAFDDILEVARESEHPRAYEVAAKTMDSLLAANKELLIIHKQMRELTGQKATTSGTHIDNAVFVGSTAELLKALKENKK